MVDRHSSFHGLTSVVVSSLVVGNNVLKIDFAHGLMTGEKVGRQHLAQRMMPGLFSRLDSGGRSPSDPTSCPLEKCDLGGRSNQNRRDRFAINP